ncbi:MAG: DUF4384 domain-containing protein [Desulfomonile tiedjei]|nr:DUF4384 domain-containing protein [Desulfomonile tiedjei]
MFRNSKASFVVLLAWALILFGVSLGVADEKTISFTKDINVLPTNTDGGTKITVSVQVDKMRVNPGDTVQVFFEADQDCYLTLIDVGTSRKITRLWPNQFSGADNLVKAKQRYSFPAATDRFQFRVSGPEGVERIVAYATSEKNKILKEEDFSDYQGGFKSYSGNLKDLVVEASKRTDQFGRNVRWGTSETRFVIGRGTAGGSVKSSNIYVLSVGAATGALRYCDDDARKFAQAIGDKLRVPPENTRIVVGPQSSKTGFADGVRWLVQKTQPEDLAFVYFSGHGTLVRDQPPARHPDGLSSAFVCYHQQQTLRPDSPELKQILMLGHDFGSILKEVPARRKLVVVDSCHSGEITKDVTGNLVSKYLPLLSDSQMKEIQIVAAQAAPAGSPVSQPDSDLTKAKESLLAACLKREQSFEDRSKQSGLFTYWLLQAMQSGTPDLQTAFDKAREKVLEDTGTAGLRQTPQVTDEYGLAKDIKF